MADQYKWSNVDLEVQLPFGKGMHDCNPSQDDLGTTEILEAKHEPNDPLDRPVILLDEIVQVLGLAEPDRGVALGIDGLQRRVLSRY